MVNLEFNDCKITYENFEDEIRTIFSTEYILFCYHQDTADIYKRFYTYENVKKVINNKELMLSIQEFFNNNLNLTKTSKNCFMHKNTLIYRLNKIKRLLALDIRKFQDAVLLLNMLTVYKNRKF